MAVTGELNLRPLHKPASGHPDVEQRKKSYELFGVLRKNPIAQFEVNELTLDNPKRMLHLCSHAGFELFDLFKQHALSGCAFMCGANVRQQIAPRHDFVYFFEHDLHARAPGDEIESEVCLFHADKASNLCLNRGNWGGVLNLNPSCAGLQN